MFKIQYINTKFLVLNILLFSIYTQPVMSTKKLLHLDFEVYGVVQGVFFRKYTEKQAKSLGLKGWCMNTHAGTVKGAVEGEDNAIQNMKKWLQYTGSPSSKIDKAVLNEKEIDKFEFKEFKIIR